MPDYFADSLSDGDGGFLTATGTVHDGIVVPEMSPDELLFVCNRNSDEDGDGTKFNVKMGDASTEFKDDQTAWAEENHTKNIVTF